MMGREVVFVWSMMRGCEMGKREEEGRGGEVGFVGERMG